jgi:hypothetical protein
MRVKIAAGATGDPSLVEVSKADVAAMALEAGAHVTLRGRKQRRTTCVVVEDDKLPAGEVRLSATALANVRLSEGDDVIIAPEADLAEAERVLLLPFASDLAEFDGTADDAFEQALGPYLKDNDRPLTVGDIVPTTAGDSTIRWKVLELEPEGANPLEAARGERRPWPRRRASSGPDRRSLDDCDGGGARAAAAEPARPVHAQGADSV